MGAGLWSSWGGFHRGQTTTTLAPSQFADRKTSVAPDRMVAGVYLVALLVAACLLTVVLAGMAFIAIIIELRL